MSCPLDVTDATIIGPNLNSKLFSPAEVELFPSSNAGRNEYEGDPQSDASKSWEEFLAERDRVASGIFGRVTEKPNGCWIFDEQDESCTYSRIRLHGKMAYVHRIIYAIFNGPLRLGDFVTHVCDTPKCCNPKHLVLGTNVLNMRDAVEKARFPRGEQRVNALFSDAQVMEMRTRYAAGASSRDLAAEYGAPVAQMRNIIKGRCYKYLPIPPLTAPRPSPRAENRRRGATHPHTQLTDEIALKIRSERASGKSYPEIGRRYGIGTSTARAICVGGTWTHLPTQNTDPYHDTVMEMRRKWAAGVKIIALVKEYGISRGTIRHIVHGRYYPNLPLIPKATPPAENAEII